MALKCTCGHELTDHVKFGTTPMYCKKCHCAKAVVKVPKQLSKAQVSAMRAEHPEYFQNWGGAFEPKTESDQKTIIKVASKRHPSVKYQMTILAGKAVSCSCAGFSNHRKCYHTADYNSQEGRR